MPQILLGMKEHIWRNFARSGGARLKLWEIEVCLEIKDNHLETMSVFVHVDYTFFFLFCVKDH